MNVLSKVAKPLAFKTLLMCANVTNTSKQALSELKLNITTYKKCLQAKSPPSPSMKTTLRDTATFSKPLKIPKMLMFKKLMETSNSHIQAMEIGLFLLDR